jgi:hypothetical protein
VRRLKRREEQRQEEPESDKNTHRESHNAAASSPTKSAAITTSGVHHGGVNRLPISPKPCSERGDKSDHPEGRDKQLDDAFLPIPNRLFTLLLLFDFLLRTPYKAAVTKSALVQRDGG